MLSMVGTFFNMEISGVMTKKSMSYLILKKILWLILKYGSCRFVVS